GLRPPRHDVADLVVRRRVAFDRALEFLHALRLLVPHQQGAATCRVRRGLVQKREQRIRVRLGKGNEEFPALERTGVLSGSLWFGGPKSWSRESGVGSRDLIFS